LTDTTLGSLNVAKGDAVHLTQGCDGFRVVAHDPNFPNVMEVYKQVAKDYRNPLRELAK
jgi:hypothetical protein